MSKKIIDYWAKYYVSLKGHCSLCGNRGFIDTRGLRTPAGVACGALHYCICPNGQAMRKAKVDRLVISEQRMV